MAVERPVGVGLIGLGTIGTGVVKVLQRNAERIRDRLGFPLRLLRIADLDLDRDRGVDLSGIRFDADAEGLIRDPDVEVVVELVGGTGAARRLSLAAIGAGKPLVTANKALLALHGAEIFGAAARRGVDVAFEASVGGGIPVLRALREGLCANEILSVAGIMNGTTNYVLCEMERTGEDFEVVLKRAQELGFAEADPTFDVEGIDAAHKLTLLVAMAFGIRLATKEIPTEGIREIAPVDLAVARELGYAVKLLGIARQHAAGGGVEARVHPTLVPADSLLASVDGAMNAIAITGDAVGPTLYYGAGAGELPTASAVVADLMEVARGLRADCSVRVPPLGWPEPALADGSPRPLGELETRYYLRFSAVDRPGVLARISTALGDEGISIESVIQKARAASGGAVPVIMLTHRAREARVRAALQRLEELAELTAPTRLVRIEEEF